MEKTFETPGHTRLFVDNAVGRVSVATSDTATTRVTLEAESDDAQDLVERATVDCRPHGDSYALVVKIPNRRGARFTRRNGVTIRIAVPEGTDADIKTASADIDLLGRFGRLDLSTASGDIDHDGRALDATAKTASSDVVLGSVEGDVNLKSASGDFRAAQVDGRLVAVTVSGDLDVGAAGAGLDVRCTSGDVRAGEVRGDVSVVNVSGSVRVSCFVAGQLKMRSVSGDVEVGVARGVRLVVDAETMSGSVHSDIPLHDVPGPDAGGAEVKIWARSVSGDVSIERAVEAYATA